VNAADIPSEASYDRIDYLMAPLLARAADTSRSSWKDIPSCCGIYAVHLAEGEEPRFRATAGGAKEAQVTEMKALTQRWKAINARRPTDILYIGKADSLRTRIRQLLRFGVGRGRNHRGGEEMWQIANVEGTRILAISCPLGKHVGFENALLDRYESEHGRWPLANRTGRRGAENWWPGSGE